MKRAALIANGQIESPQKLRPLILEYQRIIAVDGGLHHCREMKVDPHLIVGDFDSCSPDLLKHYQDIPKISLSKEKDETDLEIAIEHEFKKEGIQEITLFAAWGYRIDHSLTNALFLGRYPEKLRLESGKETLYAIHKHAQIKVQIGQILSLIPIYGPVLKITTSGLKWELKNSKLDYGFIGISNVCLKEKIEITIDQGMLLCCFLKDRSAP